MLQKQANMPGCHDEGSPNDTYNAKESNKLLQHQRRGKDGQHFCYCCIQHDENKNVLKLTRKWFEKVVEKNMTWKLIIFIRNMSLLCVRSFPLIEGNCMSSVREKKKQYNCPTMECDLRHFQLKKTYNLFICRFFSVGAWSRIVAFLRSPCTLLLDICECCEHP